MSALEEQAREVRSMLDGLGSEDGDGWKLQPAIQKLVVDAEKAQVKRDVLLGWLGFEEPLTQDPEIVGRLIHGLEGGFLPPRSPARADELCVASLWVGHNMGGQTNLYIAFRKDDGSIHAAYEHTAFPE